MQTLIQCFAAVQVDPSPILNQNATIVSDKFSFVGNDSASATNFCKSVLVVLVFLSHLCHVTAQILGLVTRERKATRIFFANVLGFDH